MSVQSNSTVLNTQGKQKLVQLVRYSRVFIKANQMKGKLKQFDIVGIRYIPCSIEPNLTVLFMV